MFGVAAERGPFGSRWTGGGLCVISVYATVGWIGCAGALCGENGRSSARGRGRKV